MSILHAFKTKTKASVLLRIVSRRDFKLKKHGAEAKICKFSKPNMLSYAYFYEELDPDCETVIETLSNEGKESFGG